MATHRGRLSFCTGLLAVCISLAGCSQYDVLRLAGDETAGRDNDTPGSALARAYLIDQLSPISQGLNPAATGRDAYTQAVPGGTNVVSVIRGTALPNQYVIVGAHYDHLGSECAGSSARDRICNGATDNAAGVAAVLGIARAIAADRPRRSVVLALWDREEDFDPSQFLGSATYVQNPLVPLDRTVAYVNFDIQGANLLPSLRTTSFAVAAESGGPELQQMVRTAINAGTLNTEMLSGIFGQGRSDYVSFLGVGVPSVFFTDASGPCYHTVSDEFDIVDFDKLDQQIAIGARLTRLLADTSQRPQFVSDNPVATYDDAVVASRLLDRIWTNRGRFSAANQDLIRAFRVDINRIVVEGRASFGPEDAGTLLGDASTLVNFILTDGPCRGFLANPSDALEVTPAG